MRVAMLGSGKVGRALAGALRRAGHAITFGVREPSGAAADELAPESAVAGADAVILAVPYAAAASLVSRPEFAGKIVIDATNPLAMGADGLGLALGFTTSGAEQIATAAPTVRLVKAFNQTGFENLANARSYPAPPVMFVAGDDAAARRVAATLVTDAGFEAIDLGALRAARLIEAFAMLWIELARKRGRGPDFTFGIQQRSEP